MNRWIKLVTPLALAGLLVGAVATPAHAQTVLDHGHVDVFDIDFNAGALDVNVRAYPNTGVPGLYDPANAVIEVERDLTVPATWDICATGQAWVLPQSLSTTQQQTQVWAGWNADDVADGNVTGDVVTVNLVDVDNPSGGSTGFCVLTASGGAVSQMLLDDDGSPTSFTVPAEGHAHANWVFAQLGTYEVTVNITAGGATASGNHTFTFEVI